MASSEVILFVILVTGWSPKMVVLSCCEHILLDVDQGSEIHTQQGRGLGFYNQIGMYGSRPQYRQMGGKVFLYFDMKIQKWIVTRHHVGNNTSGLLKSTSSYCPENIDGWKYYHGGDDEWKESSNDPWSMRSSCATLEDTCCKYVNISSPANTNHKNLGLYTAIGSSHGRFAYQKKGMDSYLEYEDDKSNWFIKGELGVQVGYIYHNGGSVCPEKASNTWKVLNNSAWNKDSYLTIECVHKEEESDIVEKHEVNLNVTNDKLTKQEIEIELDKKKVSRDIQESSYITVCETTDDNSGAVIGLIVFSCILVLILFFILARRGHQSWRKGAQGTKLIKETFGL